MKCQRYLTFDVFLFNPILEYGKISYSGFGFCASRFAIVFVATCTYRWFFAKKANESEIPGRIGRKGGGFGHSSHL
jgi:hypothetical protein